MSGLEAEAQIKGEVSRELNLCVYMYMQMYPRRPDVKYLPQSLHKPGAQSVSGPGSQSAPGICLVPPPQL